MPFNQEALSTHIPDFFPDSGKGRKRVGGKASQGSRKFLGHLHRQVDSVPWIFLNYIIFPKNCQDLGYLNVKMDLVRMPSYLHLCNFFTTYRKRVDLRMCRNEINPFLCYVSSNKCFFKKSQIIV